MKSGRYFKTVLAMLLGMLLANAPTGAAENLLKNPELQLDPGRTNAISGWSFSPADGWARKTRLAHPAAPCETPYIERQLGRAARADAMQAGVPLETNTWYILTALVRGDLVGAGMTLGINDAIVRLGPCSAWVRARCFYFSGTNTAAQAGVGFDGQGEIGLGACELRKSGPADYAGALLLDGDFENGVAGQRPTDWRAARSVQKLEIATDGASSFGKQTMKVTANDGHFGITSVQQVPEPAPYGTTVRVSYWAKADADGVILRNTVQLENKDDQYEPHYRFTKKNMRLTREWQEFSMECWIGPTVDKGDFSIYIKGSPTPGTKVWFDAMKVEYLPSEAKPLESYASSNRNLLMNSSFEAGTAGWDWRFPWRFASSISSPGSAALDMTTAKEGMRSLRIEVPPDSARGGRNLLDSICVSIENGAKYTVSFWMKTAATGHLHVHLCQGNRFCDCNNVPPPASGLVKLMPGDEWRRYSLEIVPKKTEIAPKKTGNRRAMQILFLQPGVYWIDAVQVEKGPLTEYLPPGALEVGADMQRLYPYYLRGETPKADVYVCSRLDRDAKLELSWTVKDWRGQVVDTGRKNISLNSKLNQPVRTVQTSLRLHDGNGAFVADFQVRDPAGGQSAGAPVIYGVFPKPREGDAEQSSFGIHLPVSYDPLVPLRGGDLDELLGTLRKIGIRWDRSFWAGTWAFIEPKQGEWRWAAFDRYVDAAARHGIQILPVLGNAIVASGNAMPKWAWSDIPRIEEPWTKGTTAFHPKIELWRNFVKEYVRHFKGRISAFEILNERGDTIPAQYVKMVQAAQEAAREVDPAARIVAPGHPGFQLGKQNGSDWLGKIMQLGCYKYLDVYSFHGYSSDEIITARGTLDESVELDAAEFAAAYGTKPIWDTEWATPSPPQAAWMITDLVVYQTNQRWHAEWVARWLVMRKAVGVERFFYHDLFTWELARRGEDEITECNNAPKPALVGYAQVCKRLDQAKFVRKLALGATTLAYLFESAEEATVVFWDYAAPDGSQIKLPLKARKVKIEDMMGNALKPAKAKGGGLILPLGGGPVYVSSKKMTGKELLECFADKQLVKIIAGKPGDAR